MSPFNTTKWAKDSPVFQFPLEMVWHCGGPDLQISSWLLPEAPGWNPIVVAIFSSTLGNNKQTRTEKSVPVLIAGGPSVTCLSRALLLAAAPSFPPSLPAAVSSTWAVSRCGSRKCKQKTKKLCPLLSIC